MNKNDPEDYKHYIELYHSCHIFLLPTKAECSAIVYCEAAAAGLPTYTYMTGGTGNYVIDGVNGYALPDNSNARDFATQILSDVDNNGLLDIHKGALELYQKKLSWEAWSDGFRRIRGIKIAKENNIKSI